MNSPLGIQPPPGIFLWLRAWFKITGEVRRIKSIHKTLFITISIVVGLINSSSCLTRHTSLVNMSQDPQMYCIVFKYLRKRLR